MVFNPNTSGLILPQLTNPGAAGDLANGKQLIDQNGNVITGNATIPKVFQFGKISRYNNSSVGSPLSGSEWEQYLTDGTASDWLYVDIPVTLQNSSASNTRYYYGSYSERLSRGWLDNFYGYKIRGMKSESFNGFELDFGSYNVMKSLGKLPLLIHVNDGTNISAQYYYVITEA